MKTPNLVAAIVLLVTVIPMSTFATEPVLSDDQETPDALIREIISSEEGEETHIQLGENLDVEQLTQDPLVSSTKPTDGRIHTESAAGSTETDSNADEGSTDTGIDASSSDTDKETSLPTLVQEEVPSKNAVNEENKIKEKKPKKKWDSVFTRDTDEQRTDLETPDPLLDDF